MLTPYVYDDDNKGKRRNIRGIEEYETEEVEKLREKNQKYVDKNMQEEYKKEKEERRKVHQMTDIETCVNINYFDIQVTTDKYTLISDDLKLNTIIGTKKRY
jgi:hypothetical protein